MLKISKHVEVFRRLEARCSLELKLSVIGEQQDEKSACQLQIFASRCCT